MRNKILQIFALVACILALYPVTALSSVSKYLEQNIVEFKLSNGMKWLLLRHGSARVFSGVINVKVGSVEEEEGKTGLAHFLEHMAFKGTEKISGQELWDEFVTNGATGINASTGKDETSYYASMPSDKLEKWLYLESEMIKHSVLREFYKERDVVLEERRTSVENNPRGKLYNALLETAFQKSPYKWATIGKKEEVSKLEPSDLEEFKKKYYTPDRMVGVLVGNFNTEKAKALIEKYFSAIPRAKKVKGSFPAEEPQTKERRVSLRLRSSPIIYIAFHKPTLPHHDDYVFDILTYILCNSESSRLKQELVDRKKLVRAVGCDSSVPGARLDNLFVISAEPVKGVETSEVEEAITAELERLEREPPSADEMEMAKNNIVADSVFGLLGNEGLAENLAYFETITGSWRYLAEHEKKIEQVKPEDVKKIAEKYFTKENKTLAEITR